MCVYVCVCVCACVTEFTPCKSRKHTEVEDPLLEALLASHKTPLTKDIRMQVRLCVCVCVFVCVCDTAYDTRITQNTIDQGHTHAGTHTHTQSRSHVPRQKGSYTWRKQRLVYCVTARACMYVCVCVCVHTDRVQDHHRSAS